MLKDLGALGAWNWLAAWERTAWVWSSSEGTSLWGAVAQPVKKTKSQHEATKTPREDILLIWNSLAEFPILILLFLESLWLVISTALTQRVMGCVGHWFKLLFRLF